MPKGKFPLGGLGFGGGLTLIALGSYGEIQGPRSVRRMITPTIAAPIIVIQPAEPLPVSEVNLEMRPEKIALLVFTVGIQNPPRSVSSGQGMRT